MTTAAAGVRWRALTILRQEHAAYRAYSSLAEQATDRRDRMEYLRLADGHRRSAQDLAFVLSGRYAPR